MKDISTTEHVKIFVDAFYLKIQQDELLAPVFALRINENEWEKHLNSMYDFWNTVLSFQKKYKGNPFAKHLDLPITAPHFERWLTLFHETIDSLFYGDKASEAKRRATNMASMFKYKIEYFTQNSTIKPIM